MRLEFYSSEKLQEEVKSIIGKYLDLDQNKIFFFGSRVTKKGNERSDIDLGIEGEKEISWQVMAKIKEDLENLPILYKIDVVDFKKVSPDFYDLAKQKIEVL